MTPPASPRRRPTRTARRAEPGPARRAKPKTAKPKTAQPKTAKKKGGKTEAAKRSKEGTARSEAGGTGRQRESRPGETRRNAGTGRSRTSKRATSKGGRPRGARSRVASDAHGSLAPYRAKRDFAATPEPSGSTRRGNGGGRGGMFVIQKHDATRLHYDFRLEVDGVLKSWAVPKGPSLDPRVKRLAMPTEDHPLDYADFEGVIPEGHYGAGPVIVWDRGTYENRNRRDDGSEMPMAEAIQRGHVVFSLDGEKLRGRFALRRTDGRGAGGASGRRPSWLLIKTKGEHAAPERDLVRERPESVLSQRTLDEVLDGEER